MSARFDEQGLNEYGSVIAVSKVLWIVVARSAKVPKLEAPIRRAVLYGAGCAVSSMSGIRMARRWGHGSFAGSAVSISGDPDLQH